MSANNKPTNPKQKGILEYEGFNRIYQGVTDSDTKPIELKKEICEYCGNKFGNPGCLKIHKIHAHQVLQPSTTVTSPRVTIVDSIPGPSRVDHVAIVEDDDTAGAALESPSSP